MLGNSFTNDLSGQWGSATPSFDSVHKDIWDKVLCVHRYLNAATPVTNGNQRCLHYDNAEFDSSYIKPVWSDK
jgi:hypothetical protein